MLVRAAHRRALPDAIRNRIACEQLCLPWLCPAYSTPRREQRRLINVDTGSQGFEFRRRNSNGSSNKPARRALATAVNYRPTDDIPFEGLSNGIPLRSGTHYDGINSMSRLKPLDTLSPMLLDSSLATAPPRYRTNRAGVGGDLSEMLSVFNACMLVGKLERAGIILKRVAK